MRFRTGRGEGPLLRLAAKYSRWVEVTLVPDERVETLVRTLVDHFAAFGGIPLLAVFDRPKTVALKWGRDGVVTEWNPTFAGVALDLGLGVEVCWPYRPAAEGSGREPGRLGEGLLLQAAPLPRREDLDAAARRVAGRGEHGAPVARHGRPARHADRRGAGAAASAEGRAGGPGAAHPGHRRARPASSSTTPTRTRCRPTRSASPARSTSIAIASASSPGRFSAEHLAPVGSPGTARPCRSTARSAWPPCPGKRARRYLQREHLLELGAAGAGVPHRARPSPPADLDPRRRAAARAAADARRRGAACRLRARPRGAGDRCRVRRALPRRHRPAPCPSISPTGRRR